MPRSDEMTQDTPPRSHPLSTLFEPRSIALVGASEKSVWSHFIIRNYADFGYTGKVFAVNRNGATVYGVAGFASCRSIGQPVDVAFIFVPQTAVIEALEDAAAAGIRHAVILSSGYSETGPAGAAAQRELLASAARLGMRVWGPNTLGFNNLSARAPVSAIAAVMPILPPSIAIVSQSGATAAELNEYAHSQNIGTSFVAATGNQGDVTLSDVLDYLVDHAATKAIAVFAESIRDPVILKIGRSALANAVATAHTGSLVGDDKVFGAICERLGIIRVFSTEDLINVAGLLASTGPLRHAGFCFMSISGGACTLVADAAEGWGVQLPPFDETTMRALAGVLPDFASSLNPLDVTGAAVRDPGLFERILPIVAAAPGIGLVAVGMTIPTTPGQGLPTALEAIGRALRIVDTPVVMAQTCVKALNDVSREAIESHGLPFVITGIDPMLRAVGKASWWSKSLGRPAKPLLLGRPPMAPRPLSTERAVLDYLAQSGVPVIPGMIVRSREEAAKFASSQDDPWVLKISSPDIAHKTEVGGVRLNVTPADVPDSYDSIMNQVARVRPDAAIDGIIISPMRSGGGVELLVGVTNDATWGPTIAVGFGGVMVEVMADVSIAPLPVDREEVIAMLLRLRGAKLLQSFRGAPAANLVAVADSIVNIGIAAVKLGPSLASLEVNPLLVRGDRVDALDGLVVWNDKEKSNG
jgi:acetate---CoA ligase (ADP-forming)